MDKATKAQRIFRNTYTKCRLFVKNHGLMRDDDGSVVGFTGLIYGDDETVCTRTCNVIQALINTEEKSIQQAYDFGVIDGERARYRRDGLEMVKATLRNQRNNL